MNKTLSLMVILLALVVASPGQDAEKKEAPSPKTKVTYRIDFKIYEVEDGKRINQREYSLLASTNSPPSSIRVGTRVPVTLEEKKTSYMDVGVDLDCRLYLEKDRLWGNFNVNISSFALPEQNADPRAGGSPVVRSVRQGVETSLTPGRSLVLTSIDDVNSKKRTIIEVNATQLD